MKTPVDGVDAVVGWAHGGVRAVRRPSAGSVDATAASMSSKIPSATAANSAAPRAGTSSETGTRTASPETSAKSCMSSGLALATPPQATISVEFDPVLGEVLHDPPVAKRDRLEQRPIDVLAGGMECEATEHAGEVGVGQDRAVAVEPIECDEAGFAGTQLRSRALERGEARAGRSQVVARTRRTCRRPLPALPHSRSARAGSRLSPHPLSRGDESPLGRPPCRRSRCR